MLQGHAGTSAGDRRRRVASILVLANVALVVFAAVWRHAAADNPQSAQGDRAEQSTGAPQVELPSADEAASPQPSLSTVPVLGDNPALAGDPVMEELQKVIRDPDSGLELPRLNETSPLAARANASRASDFDSRLQQRIETMHSLSAAALALTREAHSLSDAGQTKESAILMQHAADLRKMIAALAAVEL